MAGSQTSVTSNAATLAAQLNLMAGKLADPEPVLRRAQQLIARSEAEVWATQGAHIGQHWPPAAEPESKRDSRLLVASGRLRDSLARQGSPLQVRGSQLVVGTSVEYGVFHQYGTSKMPRRSFLGIPEGLARDLIQLFEAELAAKA